MRCTTFFTIAMSPSYTASLFPLKSPLLYIVHLFSNAVSCRNSKLIMVQSRIFPSVKIQPYIPAPAPAPLCKCPKYCLLVVFHAAMYFSMQFVKVVCSEEEMEEPGLGIARSKQCSLTFCSGFVRMGAHSEGCVISEFTRW